MKTWMKPALVSMVAVFAATMFVVSPALAKKDKKGASYAAPTVTAEQAIVKVKTALPNLTTGKGYIKTGKRGEKNLEVTLVHGGQIVSRVKVNPSTGEIMPKGMKVLVQNVSATQEQAINIVKDAIPKFEVGSARLGKHGEWVVDITLKQVTVASVAVHGGTGELIPDWKASRDAARW